MPPLLPILAQTAEPDRLTAACGEEPGPFCTWVLEVTDIVPLAALAGRVIPALLQIVTIVVVAYVANRLARRAIKRFTRSLAEKGLTRIGSLTHKAPLSETKPIDLARATMRTETIGGVLRSVATFSIWTIAIVMVLGTLGINLGPLIAGAGIAGIALGFGAQNLVKDFLSGIFMLLEDQYGVGDIIDVGEATGTVEAVSLRTTRVRDLWGVVWHVPNGEIRRVGNMSQQWARALIDVGVAYDTDIEGALEVIKRTADAVWQDPEWASLILEEPDVWGVQELAADGIILRFVVKTVPLKQWVVERELRRRLKDAFDEAGIEIPFPQRTIWVRGDGEDEDADGSSNGASQAQQPPFPRAPRQPGGT